MHQAVDIRRDVHVHFHPDVVNRPRELSPVFQAHTSCSLRGLLLLWIALARAALQRQVQA